MTYPCVGVTLLLFKIFFKIYVKGEGRGGRGGKRRGGAMQKGRGVEGVGGGGRRGGRKGVSYLI